ncbi:hypothetical protein F4814DRAFT_401411 [Daldinia grandis]|nr:hypothetical protein F4814DRAFT_401411 [Daldinia grandis]
MMESVLYLYFQSHHGMDHGPWTMGFRISSLAAAPRDPRERIGWCVFTLGGGWFFFFVVAIPPTSASEPEGHHLRGGAWTKHSVSKAPSCRTQHPGRRGTTSSHCRSWNLTYLAHQVKSGNCCSTAWHGVARHCSAVWCGMVVYLIIINDIERSLIYDLIRLMAEFRGQH